MYVCNGKAVFLPEKLLQTFTTWNQEQPQNKRCDVRMVRALALKTTGSRDILQRNISDQANVFIRCKKNLMNNKLHVN